MKKKLSAFLGSFVFFALLLIFGLAFRVGEHYIKKDVIPASVEFIKSIMPTSVKVMVDDTPVSFRRFVYKYGKLDPNQLSVEEREIYYLLSTKFRTYLVRNKLKLSPDNEEKLLNVIWRLVQEDVEVSDDIYGAVAKEFKISEDEFINLFIETVKDVLITVREPSEEEIKYFALVEKAQDFDETKLSSEQKEIFVRLEKNASNFINEYEIDFDEDEIYLFTVVLYNAMSSKDDLETFLVFHEYDIEDFKELVGDLYEKFEMPINEL